MNATVSEIIGLAASVIVLAGLTVIVINGGKVARVVTASGNVFVKSLRAATLR